MSQNKKETVTLTKEQIQEKELKDKKSGELVCRIMMSALGLISSPKILSIITNRKRYSQQFQIPNLYTFIGILSGFLFILVAFTILLRIFTGKSIPAEYKDPQSIQSINELIKKSIICSLSFLGIYIYVLKKLQNPSFDIQILPYFYLGTLFLQFFLRVLQIIVDIKGLRYLAQSITFFIFCLISFEIYQ